MLYYYRANHYGMIDDNDRALADYTESIRLDPDQLLAYSSRAGCYVKKGEIDRAIDDWSAVIRVVSPAPGLGQYLLVRAYSKRGDAYSRKGEYNKAIADYTQAIGLFSPDAEDYSKRGCAYAARKDFPAAIADFTEAIRLEPKDPETFYNRGTSYLKVDQYDKAVDDLTRAIQLKADFSSAHNNRGRAYLFKGENDKALADFSEAVRLDRNNVPAYLNRATVLIAQELLDSGRPFGWLLEDLYIAEVFLSLDVIADGEAFFRQSLAQADSDAKRRGTAECRRRSGWKSRTECLLVLIRLVM